jgi:hypothetical protein
MLSIALVQVAILWCIAGLAFIGALNTRGFFRSLLSWLATVAIVSVAVFFSYVKTDSELKQAGLDGITAPPRAVSAPNSGFVEKQLLESALAISDSILTFPKRKYINDQGIEKLETFVSKALSLRNKSMEIYSQIRGLTLPADGKEYHDLLLAAAENLRLAGYEIHSQFGHEQDGNDSLNKAAVHAAQAKGAFLQLKEQL